MLSFIVHSIELDINNSLKHMTFKFVISLWKLTCDMKIKIFTEIHFYLIHLNNDQRVIREIKNKVNLIKRVDNLSKIIFHRAVVTQSVDHSKSDHLKSRDAILTSVKKADVLVEICFICHKSGHRSRECSDRPTRINAVNNEYDRFEFDFDSNSDSKN